MFLCQVLLTHWLLSHLWKSFSCFVFEDMELPDLRFEFRIYKSWMTEYFHWVDGNASLFEVFHFLYSIFWYEWFSLYIIWVYFKSSVYIYDLYEVSSSVQDCSISSAKALEILLSYTKPLKWKQIQLTFQSSKYIHMQDVMQLQNLPNDNFKSNHVNKRYILSDCVYSGTPL